MSDGGRKGYTDEQCLAALAKHGTQRPAAASLGLNARTFTRRLARIRARQNQDPAIQRVMDEAGTGIVPDQVWLKAKGYSLRVRPDQPSPEDYAAALFDQLSNLTSAPLIPAPARTLDELMTVYPLFDVHFGQQSWGKESGEDYDMKLAAQDIRAAYGRILQQTPESKEALLIIGGDFYHADDTRSETPANRHRLDTDNRFEKVQIAGVELVEGLIKTLLSRHDKVTVWVLRGNHDEHAHFFLKAVLSARFQSNCRVVAEVDHGQLRSFQWGNSLIGAHHGDKNTPNGQILAWAGTDPLYSPSKHRFFFTGHRHKESVQNIGGTFWMGLPAVTARDAYAAQSLYLSMRRVSSMTFSLDRGMTAQAHDPMSR